MTTYLTSSNNGYLVRETYPQKQPPTYAKEWFGTEDQVRATSSYWQGLGWKVEVSNDEDGIWHGSTSITANLNGDSPDTGSVNSGSLVSGSTIVWSYDYNTVQKDFLESNDIVPWLNYLPSYQLAALRSFVNNETDENGALPPLHFANMTGLQMSVITASLSLIRRGGKTLPVNVPILSRTMTVPETQDLTVFYAYTNPPRVFSKDTLVSTEYVPDRYANQLRQDTDPSTSDTDGIPYIYGWQKQEPKSQDTGNGTVQVSQQWVYGLYPQNVFGPRL